MCAFFMAFVGRPFSSVPPLINASLKRERRPTTTPSRTPRPVIYNDASAGLGSRQKNARRSANYQSDIWGHNFIQSLEARSIDKTSARDIGELKECMKYELRVSDPIIQLQLIDDIQRLGLDSHFKEEIKRALEFMPTSYDKGIVDDLHSTSLYFRLRRQHGFAASQSMFDGFKDQSGAFMENLSMDMKGMLSLYEASHFAFEGGELMNHARAFTTKCLESVTGHLQMEPQVTHTLELPLCQWMQRLEARWYIDYLHDKRGEINPALLELAKLDFNMSMNVHQSELQELSGWWIDLGLARKLSFARDRLVESFFCAAAILPELQFGNGRKALTKVAAMIITLDDLYDVYGLLDELELFTNVVERWDINAMEQLPENMKICALALENITNEIARDIMREEGWDALPYLRCEWVKLCKSFLVEARWHAKGQLPTLEEYLQNAWISSSGPLLLIYSFFLSRQKITPELIDCIIASPDIIRSASMVFRLCNDLVTWKAELERGDAPSSIHCYMHGAGVSEAMACEHIKKLIDLEWKAMNEQSFVLSPFSKEFNVICMNLARMSHCLYNHGDGIGSPGKRAADNISSLLMEPIGSKKI